MPRASRPSSAALSFAALAPLLNLAAACAEPSPPTTLPDSARRRAARALKLEYTPNPFHIFTASLPDGQVCSPYSEVITASDGMLPFSFSVVAGSLPAGLTISPNSVASSLISGTPQAEGASTFTVEAIDGALTARRASFTIRITGALITGSMRPCGSRPPWISRPEHLDNGADVSPPPSCPNSRDARGRRVARRRAVTRARRRRRRSPEGTGARAPAGALAWLASIAALAARRRRRGSR